MRWNIKKCHAAYHRNGKTLKLKMVAEGIETSKQEEWLRQHGVHYGQGWLYSKALPKEDFLRWAEQHL